MQRVCQKANLGTKIVTKTHDADAFIEAASFYLRPVEEDDYINHFQAWVNDQEVTHFMWRGTMPSSKADAIDAFHEIRKSDNDVEFAIVAKDSGETIGFTGLHEVNNIYRSAEFRILIGEKSYWGKGVGTEALKFLCAYGFETLNLNRVSLGVNGANAGALKSYEKAGFITEGSLKQAIYRNGQYYDVTMMRLLKDEYNKALEAWSCKNEIIQRFRNSG